MGKFFKEGQLSAADLAAIGNEFRNARNAPTGRSFSRFGRGLLYGAGVAAALLVKVNLVCPATLLYII